MKQFPTQNLVGVIHGHLLPTKVLLWGPNGCPMIYQCTCLNCGNENFEVLATDLAWFRVRSCGCVGHNDIYKMKFNRLTAVHDTGLTDTQGHPIWEWKCDCGNRVLKDKDTVTSGNTTSCGCYQKEQRFCRPFNDLSGKKFGKWTVMHRVPHIPYEDKPRYMCRCECGREVSVLADSLTNGKSLSCVECARHGVREERRLDLTGYKYGKLTVVSRAPDKVYPNGRSLTMWNCVCECGNKRIVATQTLMKHAYNSCGDCHHTRGLTGTPLYKRWCSMLSRCYCKSTTEYNNYGGRGIRVCDEWRENFLNFRNWALTNGFSQELSIDRIDVNGNYCPENCRWVTMDVQYNNKRTSRLITIDGITQSLTQWATIKGFSYEQWRNKTDEEVRKLVKG